MFLIPSASCFGPLDLIREVWMLKDSKRNKHLLTLETGDGASISGRLILEGCKNQGVIVKSKEHPDRGDIYAGYCSAAQIQSPCEWPNWHPLHALPHRTAPSAHSLHVPFSCSIQHNHHIYPNVSLIITRTPWFHTWFFTLWVSSTLNAPPLFSRVSIK